MQCPNCRSNFLMIRQKTGFERLVVFFTGSRKYGCRDCGAFFRAPDRRQRPRATAMNAADATNTAHAIPRTLA